MAIKTRSLTSPDQDNLVETGLLPMIHYVFKDVNQGTTIFMDEGSNTLLITTKLADSLFLEGKVKLTTVLKACDKVGQSVSHIHHEIDLEDRDGRKHKVKCIEVPFITEPQDQPNLNKVYELFPSIPRGCLNRPNMEVGILLGQNANSLLSTGGTGIFKVDDLRIQHMVLGRHG